MLTQCIAAQAILSWKGIPTTISIGVKKAGEGDIRAHAWLMWNDELALDSSHERVDFTKVLELPTEPLVVASATNS
nr:lasso peptide biosynthesis B2 protein [Sulfitobacter indolifex]